VGIAQTVWQRVNTETGGGGERENISENNILQLSLFSVPLIRSALFSVEISDIFLFLKALQYRYKSVIVWKNSIAHF
jgi:hypothetical protein